MMALSKTRGMSMVIAVVFLGAQACVEAQEAPRSRTPLKPKVAEAERDFLSAIDALRSAWPEGHMVVHSGHSVFGITPIEIWWKPGVRRLHYVDTFSDLVAGEKGPGEPCVLLISSDSVCKILPDLLSCDCKPRHSMVAVRPNLRILPSEGWLELAPEQTFKQMFLRGDPKRSRITKTDLGGYEMTVYPLGRNTEGDGDSVSQADVFHAVFDRKGRPIQFGPREEVAGTASLRGRFEWDPVSGQPKEMRIESRMASEDDYQTYWRVTVDEFDSRCDKEASFFRFPPSDLSFGTLITDTRNPKVVRRYVGGEAGRKHRELWRKARELNRMGNP